MGLKLRGRSIIPGIASGVILRSREPISLWGGVDPETGRIVDPHHDRCGESIVGRVFVFPSEKGSSTGSAVLLELVRRNLAPAALIVGSFPPVIALGSIIAEGLYGRSVPIVVLSDNTIDALAEGIPVAVDEDGTIRLE